MSRGRNFVASAGWFLLAIAIVVVGLWVVWKAAGAGSDTAFDHWVGWANVLALPIGALGVALVLFDRVRRHDQDEVNPPANVQHITAHGGIAQGVIGGNIVNHDRPPSDVPPPRRTGEGPDDRT
ncbi:hypothetical protein KBX08_32770 [Micromonospora sp. H61]|uniref:hypothetical protein n=1 Tax=Micromonospora sp. H61 TaxID=2824888 RepID=UPI001B383740|nr:hypothetical protein [Micromonospora sp. H61]MBQ0994829.1 hypothetical protein [Micromonospora sp. H61]